MRRACVGRVLRRGCALVLAAGVVLAAPALGGRARVGGEQVDARGRWHERKRDSSEAFGGVVHLDRVVRGGGKRGPGPGADRGVRRDRKRLGVDGRAELRSFAQRAVRRVVRRAELVPGRRRHRLPQVRFAPQRTLERPRVVPSARSGGERVPERRLVYVALVLHGSREAPAPVPLVERWNGKQWSVVASPKKGSVYSELDAVACVSPTWCAAVGYYGYRYDAGRRGGERSLVELWDGKTWRIVPSPNTSGTTTSC